MKNNKKGFTLIELLVVIFIIGLLAGVLLPNFVGSRQRARDARRKHDLNEIKSALRLYYNDHQQYPDSPPPFGESWSEGETVYMSLVPQDPTYNSETGGGYNYCVRSDGDGFVLCAQLENAADSDIARSQSRCSSVCDCDCGGTTCYYVCGD
jgi:type II secretion system protein G